MILPRYEGLCMVYIYLNGIENKNVVKYMYPIVIQKWDILIIDTWMVFNKNDISPTLIIMLLV